MKTALIIVDTQNDFCPGGGYPVPDGDKIIQPLNKILAYARKNGWLIVASKDWHTRELFEDESKIHCIQNTEGAKHHKDLNIRGNEVIVTKGAHDLGLRHYSAFNGDEILLNDLFQEKGIEQVYIGGLAYDYCVKNTALDSTKYGYKTIVLTDATKAVKNNPAQIAEIESELKQAGVLLSTTNNETNS